MFANSPEPPTLDCLSPCSSPLASPLVIAPVIDREVPSSSISTFCLIVTRPDELPDKRACWAGATLSGFSKSRRTSAQCFCFRSRCLLSAVNAESSTTGFRGLFRTSTVDLYWFAGPSLIDLDIVSLSDCHFCCVRSILRFRSASSCPWIFGRSGFAKSRLACSQ